MLGAPPDRSSCPSGLQRMSRPPPVASLTVRTSWPSSPQNARVPSSPVLEASCPAELQATITGARDPPESDRSRRPLSSQTKIFPLISPATTCLPSRLHDTGHPTVCRGGVVSCLSISWIPIRSVCHCRHKPAAIGVPAYMLDVCNRYDRPGGSVGLPESYVVFTCRYDPLAIRTPVHIVHVDFVPL